MRKNKEWYLYILKLANGAYYTGITNDLVNRISAHLKGKGSKYVRSHLPFSIVHLEPINGGRSEALKREAAIKKLNRKQKEKLMAEEVEW